MIATSPNQYLALMLSNAEQCVITNSLPSIPKDIEQTLRTIVEASEAAKAVLTVVLTSAVYKHIHPEQDIRRHQSSIEGGYSGRTFDSQYITPFLKAQKFPAMAESGWLTRSLEQKMPYDSNYPGAIRPSSLKQAFLTIIDAIEYADEPARESIIRYLLALLVQQREQNKVTLAVPRNLTIAQILQLLERHFTSSYKYEGASRLPVLAIYAVYQVLQRELNRYNNITLLPLESHTSADRRSGRMGDVDLVKEDSSPFEAVEIKFGIPIGLSMIETAYEKFMDTSMQRYYILSTSPIIEDEAEPIAQRIIDIKNTHGCQIIANGIYTTLRYYLRLLADPIDFLKAYTEIMLVDKAIKHEHKLRWNELVQKIASNALS